jgi:two-component system sensor histidine kinase BaeS
MEEAGGALVLSAGVPLEIRDLSVQHGGTVLAEQLAISAAPRLTYSPAKITLALESLQVRAPAASLLRGRLVLGIQPAVGRLEAAGKLTLDGKALLAQPVLAAWWVAGRWSRPLRQLQQATHRIARGEPGVQLDVATVGRGAVEIDELLADVNAMVLSLGAMEASRRRWIAQISHELRTPLSVLRGEMESIEDGARAPTPGVMASLREEVVQLTRLVDDLHMLSMADINQLSCSFAAGDISEALARMARRFETRATQLGLSLLFKAGAPALVAHWDWGRIEQLLSNLLENSLRYTNAPGQIQVHWRLQQELVLLTVEDSAPGVAAENLHRLFEPLFRLDAARTRTGQHGSGLGLSIVRAIVQAHQGKVQAKPSPLGGLTIEVALPLQPQTAERKQASA